MQGVDARQRLAPQRAHLRRDVVVKEHAVAAEQARRGDVEARHAPAGHLEPEPRIEVAGDDREPGPQLGEIPRLAAEQTQRRRAILLGGARSIVEREDAHERGLAGAVRTENRRVLARVDAQGQVVQHANAAAQNGGVTELEDWRHADVA